MKYREKNTRKQVLRHNINEDKYCAKALLK